MPAFDAGVVAAHGVEDADVAEEVLDRAIAVLHELATATRPAYRRDFAAYKDLRTGTG